MGDIVYLENKKNKGLSESLNKGIKNSKGQYIIRVTQMIGYILNLSIFYIITNLNPKLMP